MAGSRDNELREKECVFLEGVRRRCPDFLPALEALGDLYTKMGRVEEGLAVDERLTAVSPSNPTYHYNLACSLALVGRCDEAISSLGKAVDLGYDDWEWMLKDGDLKAVRSLPAFVALIDALKQGGRNGLA